MSKHDGHNAHACTVAELVEREAKAGKPLRLHWPRDELDARGCVLPRQRDEWPTGELPRITSEGDRATDGEMSADTDDSESALPVRRRDTVLPEPDPAYPVWVQDDLELLGRVLVGLRGLG